MKKNCENIAKETIRPTRFAPSDVRERKKAKSIIGALTWRSIGMKAPSATTAMANRAIT